MSKKFIISEYEIRQAIVDYICLTRQYCDGSFNVILKYDDTQILGEKFQAVATKVENKSEPHKN